MKKVCFLDVENEDKKLLQQVGRNYEIKIFKKPMKEDEIAKKCKDAEVLCVSFRGSIRIKTMAALPNLKLIITRSAGYDHIDVEEAKNRGIVVTNITYGPNVVAEHTFALILAVTKRICQANAAVRDGKFAREPFKGIELKGKTIGIIGTGKVGLEVAALAKAFGMKILAYDIVKNNEVALKFGFDYVPLESLLKNSDVISLHVPLTSETKYLINGKNISLIKRGAILINTSRGGIVETCTLVKALNSGKLGGAGLDVIEDEEQFNKAHPILRASNLVLTPHMAAYTKETREKMIKETITAIDAFFAGKLKGI